MQLEEIFWAGVFKMLREGGKISNEIIDKLMKWRSGFSIDNGLRIKWDDAKGRGRRVRDALLPIIFTVASS
jgi:hypothetical protein